MSLVTYAILGGALPSINPNISFSSPIAIELMLVPLAPVLQLLVLPNLDFTAHLARLTEVGAGAVLLITALEVVRRRLSAPLGAQHAYEPLVALAASLSALALGVMSLVTYAILGGALPSINPNISFSSPIAIELMLVPLALGIAWLEFARFLALRRPTV